MSFEKWKIYVHSDWDGLTKSKGEDRERHYFKALNFPEEQNVISDIEENLSIDFPKDFLEFYKEIGFGFLWASDRKKKGHYRIFAPSELLDLYFEPEDESAEDLFVTFRNRAWENLEENNLLAFCDFGSEDSLIYLGLSDGAMYYLSSRNKIAASLNEFMELLDNKVDYFFN